MRLDTARYHGWNGKLGSPWRGAWALAEVGLKQVFRRKAFWAVLALALLNFLLFWSIVYAVTQLQDEGVFHGRGFGRTMKTFVFERLGFSPDVDAAQENGYIAFINRQSVAVMLLLAFAGSTLAGADFRHGCMPFFLSRRLDRRHYVFGKLLAIAAIIWSITVAPALLLFLEYGMFTSSFTYWIDNSRVLASVLGYGLLLSVALGLPLAAISAWLERTAPIAVAWVSTLLLSSALAAVLREATGENAWDLISPWNQVRYVGRWIFDVLPDERERRLAAISLAAVVTWCALSVAALMHRVRSVEIVH